MDLLGPLQSLGVPGWLVSIAALIVILDRVGLVKWAIEALHDTRESRQERESLEWEQRAQAVATHDLRQREIENQALSIAKENIQWAREDFSIMQRSVEELGRVLERVEKNQTRLFEYTRDEIRILAGAITRLADKLRDED